MSAITNLDLIKEFFDYCKRDDVQLKDVLEEFGGSTYYIPSFKTTYRNEEIIKYYRERLGEPWLIKKLAKEYNLSERQVHDITKEVRQTGSLF